VLGELAKTSSLQKIILFYNTGWGKPLAVPAAIPAPYVLTTDQTAVDDAVAVVFHLPTLPGGTIPKRMAKKRGQLWVAWSKECEAHYPQISDLKFMDRFDLRMTYRLDADIPTPYVDASLRELLRSAPAEKEQGNFVNAFISSPYNKSRRIEFLLQLMYYIDVHSYGKLFRNRNIDGDHGRETKLDTIRTYKFTLALENATAKDYVTEKFYDPLIAGSVPVYLGAPNIDEFAPGDNCFINAADWESPRALARYLVELAGDKVAYAKFLDWKTKPYRARFAALIELVKEHPFIRLCRKVEELRQKPAGHRE
jgi:hypothetical protein